MSELQQGTVVRNVKDGSIGVVINDFPGAMSVCERGEILVVYEGTKIGWSTLVTDLEVKGPENAQADLKKCGGGQGDDCCIFLVVGGEGAECQRFGELRNTLIFRDGMTAQRHRIELFPRCQLKGKE